jgi:hypothetical protein
MLSIDAGSYDIADYQFGRGLPLGPASLLLYLLWEPALVLGPVAVRLFPDGRLPSARWRWAPASRSDWLYWPSWCSNRPTP